MQQHKALFSLHLCPTKGSNRGRIYNKKVLKVGGVWLMGLLIVNVHMLSRSLAWLRMYAIQGSSWRYVYQQAHSVELCSAWQSPMKASQWQSKFFSYPLSNLNPLLFSTREAASACKYCSLLLQPHGCICLLPSREPVAVMPGHDAIILGRALLDNEVSGDTRIM